MRAFSVAALHHPFARKAILRDGFPFSVAGELSTNMTKQSTRNRIKFGELAIGQRFYDPISAEYFVKQSDQLAAMVTGIGDGSIPDEFEAEDIVGVDQ